MHLRRAKGQQPTGEIVSELLTTSSTYSLGLDSAEQGVLAHKMEENKKENSKENRKREQKQEQEREQIKTTKKIKRQT